MFEGLNKIEIEILDFIQERLRSGALDFAVPYITKLGDGGGFFIVCALIMLCFKSTRKIGLSIGIALF